MTQTRPRLTFGASVLVTACCAVFCAVQQPLVVAQDKTETPAPKDRNQPAADSAGDLIAEARKKIDTYESVKADIVEKVAIGGSRFTAVGQYVQGAGDRVRLEYTLDVAKPARDKKIEPAAAPGDEAETTGGFDFYGATNSMLQVSDGEVMYTMVKIGKDVHATRVNVKEVQRSVADMPGSSIAANWLKDLGLGGVKAMLASFEKNMRFKDRMNEKLNDDEECVRVTGTWNVEQRARMVGEGAPADAVLPGYIPDYVWLYFTPKTMFLRRVVYLKRHPAEKKIRPMVTLDFVNVEINAPVGSNAFLPPEKVTAVDETDAIIKRLEQASGKGAVPVKPENQDAAQPAIGPPAK